MNEKSDQMLGKTQNSAADIPLPPPPSNIFAFSSQFDNVSCSESPYLMPPPPPNLPIFESKLTPISTPVISNNNVSESAVPPPMPIINPPPRQPNGVLHVNSNRTQQSAPCKSSPPVAIPPRISSFITRTDNLVNSINNNQQNNNCNNNNNAHNKSRNLPPLQINNGTTVGNNNSCNTNSIHSTVSDTSFSNTSSCSNNKDYCNVCGRIHDPAANHIYSYSVHVMAELICQLCKNPLVDPLQTKCSHIFCAACLKYRLAKNAKCPEDDQIINYLECSPAVNIVKSLLDKLMVYCPNEICNDQLPRLELERHLTNTCQGVASALGGKSPSNTTDSVAPPDTSGQADRNNNSSGGGAGGRSNVRFNDTQQQCGAGRRRSSNNSSSHQQQQQICIVDDLLITDVVIPGMRSTLIIDRTSHNIDLGISFVGGADTPLQCIIIQDIYLDGAIARDGRLRPGDQIMMINDIDLSQVSHLQARNAFLQLQHHNNITTNNNATTTGSSSNSGGSSSGPISIRITVMREKIEEIITEKEDILQFCLSKRTDKKLGIKLVGQKNKPGLYVLDLVKGSEADLDGRLRKNDRILSINGVDLKFETQDTAANVINNAEGEVKIVVSRTIRMQTPDLIRTSSNSASDPFDNYKPHPSISGNSTTSGYQGSMNNATGGGVLANSPAVFYGNPQYHNSSSSSPVDSRFGFTDHLCYPAEKHVNIEKNYGESLGMSVAGGVNSQRGDTPVYVTNLTRQGVAMRSQRIFRGDILLQVNEIKLLGLSHEKAVEALKFIGKKHCIVKMTLLQAPETTRAVSSSDCDSSGPIVLGNYLPSWTYWLALPEQCAMPRLIKLRRDNPQASLGFSIVGGIDNTTGSSHQQSLMSSNPISAISSSSASKYFQQHHNGQGISTNSNNNNFTGSYSPQSSAIAVTSPSNQSSSLGRVLTNPIVIKSIVVGSIAHRNGRLKCGDLLLKVNEFPLYNVTHEYAVNLFKTVQGEVSLHVVSWPGSIV